MLKYALHSPEAAAGKHRHFTGGLGSCRIDRRLWKCESFLCGRRHAAHRERTQYQSGADEEERALMLHESTLSRRMPRTLYGEIAHYMGTRIANVAPLCGADVTVTVPLIASTRSRMLISPRPLPHAASGSKPTPLSAMVKVSSW